MSILAIGVAGFGLAFAVLIYRAFGFAQDAGSVISIGWVYMYIAVEAAFVSLVMLMAYYVFKRALSPPEVSARSKGSQKKE